MNIKSVAQKAGVSVATVSRVLNHPDTVAPDTKEHVLSVMESLDYTPNWFARGLKLNRAGVIGLLIPEFLDSGYMEIAKGVEDVAHQKKCNMMLCTTEENPNKEKEQIENFLIRRVDGIICVSSCLKKNELLQIKNQEIPLVFIGKNEDNKEENLVYTDYRAAASEAVKHIIEVGHRTIGMIMSPRPKLENMDKLEGFKRIIEEEGLSYQEDHIAKEENSIEGGYLAASKLLNQKNRPTAIFVTSDTMAIGVMEKAKQEGLKIPQDIAVVGFDNLKISAFVEPKLTTVAKPMYRMGLVATRLLFDLIEEGNQKNQEPQEILIQSKLKVRKSCGHQDRLREIF